MILFIKALVAAGILTLALLTALAVHLWKKARENLPSTERPRTPPVPVPGHRLDTDPELLDHARVHECGHALAIWFHPNAPGIVGLVVLRDGNGMTMTQMTFPPQSAETLWHDLVVMLAGLAAETVVYDEPHPPGSIADTMKAVGAIAIALQLWPDTFEMACPWFMEVPDDLDEGVFTFEDENGEQNPRMTVIAWVLHVCLWQAKRLIRGERVKHGALVAALRAKGDNLCRDEVEEVLGPRSSMKPAKPTDPSKN